MGKKKRMFKKVNMVKKISKKNFKKINILKNFRISKKIAKLQKLQKF